jgi:hypothetical protein
LDSWSTAWEKKELFIFWICVVLFFVIHFPLCLKPGVTSNIHGYPLFRQRKSGGISQKRILNIFKFLISSPLLDHIA